jgi:predicted DNA-binding ribbon-helix-helix protein
MEGIAKSWSRIPLQLMALLKKSFSLSGHRTSVALETEFWAVIDAEAAKAQQSLAGFVAEIDKQRGTRPLASALRLRALAAAKGAS